MKYYSLEINLDEKILGKIPQVKKIIHNCNINQDPNFIDNLAQVNIEANPILSNVELYSKAKVTDVIDSYGEFGFLYSYIISDKLKILLENYNIYGVKFFSTYIIQMNKRINNFWQIKFFDFPLNILDFSKTTFELKDRDENRNPITSLIQFKTVDEFLNFSKTLKYPKIINYKHLHFVDDLDLDFFSLKYKVGSGRGIVSERLKNEIENHNISGIEFKIIN